VPRYKHVKIKKVYIGALILLSFMFFYALTGLINAVTSTFLGFFVYLKNRKSKINQVFVLFCLSVAMWSYAYYFWPEAVDKKTALLSFQLLHIGAIFIPVCYLHFVLVWLNLYKEKKRILKLGYLASFILCCFVFTPLFIKDMVPKFSFKYWGEPGILYHFFLFIFFLYAFYAFYLLLKAYQKSLGTQREQIKYILIGTVIGYLGGATNYPLWYNISIPPIGNWTATLYLIIVAYAIVKYRLMDIRFVLGRGAVYTLSLITIITLAFLLMFLSNQFLSTVSFNITGPLILIICILLFQPIFRFFEKFASKYFYYVFYSYQTVLTDLGKRLTQVLDLNKLSSFIVGTLMNTMKLDRTVILIREEGNGDYRIQKNIGFKEENGISLVKDNFLTVYLEKTQMPLVYEELSLIIRDTPRGREKERLETLRRNMKTIEAALCLPLLMKEKIIGMIVLGNKVSGDPYSEQDIELLTTLSNQASIALQNAKLFSGVRNFNLELERQVGKRTKELSDAYNELKKLDKAKSEFLSIASHQLRTPLTAIKGYISMIIEKTYGEPPEKMKTPLGNIYLSNERLIKLVNSLLDVSRIEAGRLETKFERLSLADVISSVIEELKNVAREKGLYLKLEKPTKLIPEILIDQQKARQIILNLIENAIRYTEKGGVTIKLDVERSKIKIIVSDTGEGMTKEEISHLFESFSRGSAGARFWTEGAGLGLYVAKKFVEIHKGKIWAESLGKGKGSIFFVELPVK